MVLSHHLCSVNCRPLCTLVVVPRKSLSQLLPRRGSYRAVDDFSQTLHHKSHRQVFGTVPKRGRVSHIWACKSAKVSSDLGSNFYWWIHFGDPIANETHLVLMSSLTRTRGSNLNQNGKTPDIAPWILPRLTVIPTDWIHISGAAADLTKLPWWYSCMALNKSVRRKSNPKIRVNTLPNLSTPTTWYRILSMNLVGMQAMFPTTSSWVQSPWKHNNRGWL